MIFCLYVTKLFTGISYTIKDYLKNSNGKRSVLAGIKVNIWELHFQFFLKSEMPAKYILFKVIFLRTSKTNKKKKKLLNQQIVLVHANVQSRILINNRVIGLESVFLSHISNN